MLLAIIVNFYTKRKIFCFKIKYLAEVKYFILKKNIIFLSKCFKLEVYLIYNKNSYVFYKIFLIYALPQKLKKNNSKIY